MGHLSSAVRILLTLPDPPPDNEAALIDAISLIIAQSLLPVAGIASVAGAGAQEQNAAGDAAARLAGGLLERELITQAQSEILGTRVADHLQGRRDMRRSTQHASEGKLAAAVCSVIGAVMAVTSKDSRSLVENTPPFGDVAYRSSVQEKANGHASARAVAASSAPGSTVKYAGLTTAKGASVSGSATYGVSNGTQTLSYVADAESSNAKVTFSEREEGATGEASGEDGVAGEGDITSGVSVTVSGDEISYISSVTDDEGNISIVSVTEFIGTGAWTLTITSVDSSGAGTSTIITGDPEGNVTEVTISNVDEVSGVDTSTVEESGVDTSLTEDSFGTSVGELSGSTIGDEGDE